MHEAGGSAAACLSRKKLGKEEGGGGRLEGSRQRRARVGALIYSTILDPTVLINLGHPTAGTYRAGIVTTH